jgi:hypothetical protein
MPEGKRKLTLTVDSETVDAAKKLGLNISEVTEDLLRLHTFDPSLLEGGVGREEYTKLLATMDPLLRKYGCSVQVGSLEPTDPDVQEDDGPPVFYHGSGSASTDETLFDDDNAVDIFETLGRQSEYVIFLRPEQILKNFLKATRKAKDSRAEEADTLVFAMKMIEALTEAESKRAARSVPGTVEGGGQ